MSSLLPNAKQQFINPSTGLPLVGGFVYYFIPNTTTSKPTYQDQALTIANTNPITLDADGQCIAWGTGSYRQQVYDSLNNLIWDQVTSDVSQASQVTAPINAIVATQSGTVLSATLPTPPASVSAWYQVTIIAPGASGTGNQLILPNAPTPWNTALPIYWNGTSTSAGQWSGNDVLYLVWNPSEGAWDLTTIGSRSLAGAIDTLVAADLVSGTLPADVTSLQLTSNQGAAYLYSDNSASGPANDFVIRVGPSTAYVYVSVSPTGALTIPGQVTASAATSAGELTQLSQSTAGATVTDVTATRAINTGGSSANTYTNTSGRMRIAKVACNTPSGLSSQDLLQGFVAGIETDQATAYSSTAGIIQTATLTLCIPPGATYYVTQANSLFSLAKWVEIG